VDDIRNLIDQVRIPPQTGQYKVYIIDEVHMLSAAAFNAFLKTLEEPPKHAIFILATTEKHKIIPTILSRCQIFDFKRITVKDAKEHLAEVASSQGVSYEDDALHIIAQKADGAMRDALSIFDRVVSYCGTNLTRQAVTENLNVLDYETYISITNLILENNIPQILVSYNEILAKGFDGHHFIAGLASHFRDVLVCKNPATLSLLEAGEQAQKLYGEQAQQCSSEFLLKGIEFANDCDLKFKVSQNQRLLVELALMQLCSINFDGEKKNEFIIPPTYYRRSDYSIVEAPTLKSEVTSQKVEETAEKLEVESHEIEIVNQVFEVETAPIDAAQIITPTQETPTQSPISVSSQPNVSAFSLSSIRAKKEMQEAQKGIVKEEVHFPTEEFTETEMLDFWFKYAQRLTDKGYMIMASLLRISDPKLEGFKIIYELPNEGSKIDFDKEKTDLLGYLRGHLHNHEITIEVVVNESVKSKVAFTAQDKYNRLNEINPHLEEFRRAFDLDL
jgi:DNA polymerase-3 subunit gamma/tau